MSGPSKVGCKKARGGIFYIKIKKMNRGRRRETDYHNFTIDCKFLHLRIRFQIIEKYHPETKIILWRIFKIKIKVY